MSKVLEKKSESSDSYAKFAMIVIARYRFRAFVLKFQREPGPQEPIFFDERQDSPVKADLDTARRQLTQVARASRIRLQPVLEFLGMSMPANEGRTTARPPVPIRSRRPQMPALRLPSDRPKISSAWSR